MPFDCNQYDVIVVGAGFSGAVFAERMASQANKKVLVLEQRDHIGGNCYDYRNEHGILVHKYGPHLFHTDKQEVWDYLSQFTEWVPYEHKVLSRVDGKLVPLPFNLNTLECLYSAADTAEIEALLIKQYGQDSKVPILELRKSPHPQLKALAELVYEKFFVNYTSKQWGCAPEDISPNVLARVPVVISRDDRYFNDQYQAIPKEGYTALIRNILDNENIRVELNFDALKQLQIRQDGQIFFSAKPFTGLVAYTGMLDALFDYQLGELPYRSLQFDFETLSQVSFQPATTINYPNEEAFTRITEFKHILKDKSDHTTIVREYPQDYNRFDENKNVPYYPVFNQLNQNKFEEYQALAKEIPLLVALGRLADYRYYNMDDAVENAMHIANGWTGNELDESTAFKQMSA